MLINYLINIKGNYLFPMDYDAISISPLAMKWGVWEENCCLMGSGSKVESSKEILT